MATPPDVLAQFGYSLARAEQMLTRQLTQHLAQRGVEPATWYAMRLIGNAASGMPRDELIGRLEASRALDADSVRELLAKLEGDGLIGGGEQVELTAEGQEFFSGLREHVVGSTRVLLDRFDPSDLETTVRTVQAITAQVEQELAAGS